jgi:hypothetical protein
MAVDITPTAAVPYLRAGFFSAAGNAFTIMAWVRLDVLPASNAYDNLFGMHTAIMADVHNNAGTIRWSIGTATNDFDSANGVAPVAGRWYHVCLTRIGSTYALYVDGMQVATGSDATAGNTQLDIAEFGNSSSSDVWDGALAAIKAWDGCALTRDEIVIELRQILPAGVRAGQLRGCYPLFSTTSDTLDWSGHGLTLTKAGTQTVTTDPPVPLYFDPTFLNVYDGPSAAGGATFVPYQPWYQQAPVMAQ